MPGGGKTMIPAPIDRPLSRAYLREFSGWSTEYPPGLSEPTSLRVMENTMINRDGSLRVRPGLRYLTYWGAPNGMYNNTALPSWLTMLGSHEVFFLPDGTKCYLFAGRSSTDNSVMFFGAKYVGDDPFFGGLPFQVFRLDDTALSMNVDMAAIALPASTDYVKYLQIDNKILALTNGGDGMRIFYVGNSRYAVAPKSITRPDWTVDDKPDIYMPNNGSIANSYSIPPNADGTGPGGAQGFVTTAQRTAKTTLPNSASYDSVSYNIGYFYTFSNEFGESAASQIKTTKVTRRWQAWRWETRSATFEPSGTDTDDPTQAADQLAIYPERTAWDQAIAAGATGFNVYTIMWSDQDPVPVEGVLVGTKTMTPTMRFEDCWVRHSPAPMDNARTMPIPTATNRRNYSDPPKGGQGIVAADRMVVVYDPSAGAVIRWTANLLGEYTNFTASRGGGYKTLTSGNLYIPACVKLWQNAQSVDTLTVLCLGVDGYSTSFYMSPASITSQSDATTVMAFEETTATPGTTSPYGCEVLNNALYHPVESALVKSTASNYNINHQTLTDGIQNMWQGLADKQHIVSAQHDNRLYLLVHNPEGAALEAGCWGNEVWVFDAAQKQGSWSRWLVQGQSLRKLEVGGRVLMSITRPEGLYAFDDTMAVDEYVGQGVNGPRTVLQKPIPWKIETNTQGANRAHDAWCHLQQASLTLGNFSGRLRWGVRGYDLHGKVVDVAKVTRDDNPAPTDGLPWDIDDHLQIRRDLKEWTFYAESVTDGGGAVVPSSGQISLVGYRYTPVSVNVGYEYGSVETFEYARNEAVGNNTLSTNGVPVPAVDTRRP